MPNHEDLRSLALNLEDALEKPCYGTPGFYYKKKLFARLLEDESTVVIKIDKGDREKRIQADPETFFVTDHYLNHPMMIIRLNRVTHEDLAELIQDAWQIAVDTS